MAGSIGTQSSTGNRRRKQRTDHGFALLICQLMENHRAYGQPKPVSSGSPKGGIKPEEPSFSVLEAATKKSHGQQLKTLKIRSIATNVRLPGSGIRYETSEHFITNTGQRGIPCPDRFAVGTGLRQHLCLLYTSPSPRD